MKKKPIYCNTCGEELKNNEEFTYDIYTGEKAYDLVCPHFQKGEKVHDYYDSSHFTDNFFEEQL